MLGESSRMLGKATDALLELAKMPLLKRFLLGAAHILRNAQGGSEGSTHGKVRERHKTGRLLASSQKLSVLLVRA
jgi:hypothetical protein